MAQASKRLLLGGLAQSLRGRLCQAPSSLMSVRTYTEGSKLFVGGISFRTTEDGLREAFGAHGEVVDAKIIMDRETGRSRGFGFVTYYKEEDADAALSKLNGHNLDGRAIRVDRASTRPARPSSDFGSGSGFGSSFALDSSESAPADDDWGSIPSLDASTSNQ
ncbi:hypothetical protein GOP47_0015174 [Adiantum capillus-veneris]|uniref:RRM domain-containing protein n=1 Tax=Adiantum capillus-veneris TaxID=13818 RepID=A0A9D4UNJ3_ADICA|nr:hypothetical protein GOP47_0015174 [Adiantum capillus-veneris]